MCVSQLTRGPRIVVASIAGSTIVQGVNVLVLYNKG
jgi:hypothetical protein